jgi:hypothetical protein
MTGFFVLVAFLVLAGDRSSRASVAPCSNTKPLSFSGDLERQRLCVWQIFAALTETESGSRHAFLADWFNEADVFSREVRSPFPPFPGFPIGFTADAFIRATHSADAPIVTFVHFNLAAYRHIRQGRLYLEERIRELAQTGEQDRDVLGMKAIPDFPPDAAIIMTGWWPVAARGSTPMPVWDAESNNPKTGGNSYMRWSRVISVIPGPVPARRPLDAAVEFAGRMFSSPSRVALDGFYSIRVDAGTAARLMDDAGARKASIIALGRPLGAGDYLALVAIHMVSFETRAGVWGTFWWHDWPATGRFAQDRPANVQGVWRNYLMDVAFDADLPTEADLTPKICFNPWFEAKFPDGGHGNGMVSNCVNCHSRASYPRIDFLPVLRGHPDLRADPAFGVGRLRTGQVWSLANSGARPATGSGQ